MAKTANETSAEAYDLLLRTLAGENQTALEIEELNRKWVSFKSGFWPFSCSCKQHHFNEKWNADGFRACIPAIRFLLLIMLLKWYIIRAGMESYRDFIWSNSCNRKVTRLAMIIKILHRWKEREYRVSRENILELQLFKRCSK